jgi:branched-subunit amino acid ABC-type transport system permease component|uniref:Branched-chain amino acid ABC transporter permease n=1 Tax=Desulfobacca acetoxidans TaxID=60893 RepID=A0A7C5ELC7_9BACT
MWQQVVNSLTDGFLLGFVYGLAAMGLSLIWGVMQVINLAHGVIITSGMLATYLMFLHLGINPYLGMLLVAALGLGLGLVIYAAAVHRVISAPHLSSLLATFAVNMIILGIFNAVFGGDQNNVDYSLGSLSLGFLNITVSRLLAALGAVLFCVFLYLFLYFTRTGKAIRAVSNNREAAELMGIPSAQVLALSFGLGSLLAAVAGALIATIFPFTIFSGGPFELKSFVICVLGGLGNPLGALIGGLALGLLEGLIPIWMPTSWVPVVEFGLFVTVLVVRPSGLLGAK